MTPEPQVLLAAEESGATLIESAGKTEALALALQAVRKSFGSQIVLNGIDLTVGSGETLAVLGRSGTGKSVLLKLIIGMIACFQGMRTQGGTAGVGLSATSSVVLSSLFVILADVILVKFILVFFS